jgi:hypothetical protein
MFWNTNKNMLLKGEIPHNVVVLYVNKTVTKFSAQEWGHIDQWCNHIVSFTLC